MSHGWACRLLAVVLLAGLGSACSKDDPEALETEQALEAVAHSTDGEAGGISVRLFYPGESGLLELDQRSIVLEDLAGGPDGGSTADRLTQPRQRLASAVVQAVLAAPETEGLFPSFEQGTELRALEFFAGGLVLVSLGPPTGSVNRGLGSRAELLRLYSLVNSLAYSVRGIESVQVLWGDSQPVTLAGHVDTTRPIKPSLDWVAPASRRMLQAAAREQSPGPGSSGDG